MHAALLEHSARGLRTVAHLGLTHLADLGLVNLFDGIGQMIVRPRAHGAHIAAEAQNHALFVGLDDIDAGQAPQRHHGQNNPFGAGHANALQGLQRIASVASVSAPPGFGRPPVGTAALRVGFVAAAFVRSGPPLLMLPFFLKFIPIPIH